MSTWFCRIILFLFLLKIRSNNGHEFNICLYRSNAKWTTKRKINGNDKKTEQHTKRNHSIPNFLFLINSTESSRSCASFSFPSIGCLFCGFNSSEFPSNRRSAKGTWLEEVTISSSLEETALSSPSLIVLNTTYSSWLRGLQVDKTISS